MSAENNKYSLGESLSDNYESNESFSLESILAEYKRSAFIDGERKTPADKLDKQVEDIINEITGKKAPSAPSAATYEDYSHEEDEQEHLYDEENEADGSYIDESEDEEADDYESEEDYEDEEPAKRHGLFGRFFSRKERNIEPEESYDDDYDEPEVPVPNSSDEEPENDDFNINELFGLNDSGDSTDVSDEADRPYDRNRFTRSSRQDSSQRSSMDDDSYFESMEFADKIAKNVENPDWELPADFDEDEPEEDEELPQKESLFARLAAKFAGAVDEEDEEEEPDPDFSEEMSRFSKLIPSLKYRIAASGVICIIMLIITHMAVDGKTIPLGIGTNLTVAGGVVLILQLAAMAVGLDVLIEGLESLVYVEPCAESLVFISNVLSFIDGFIMLLHRDFTFGMPLSLVSTASLVFALHARKAYCKSMSDSMKLASTVTNSYGVVSEQDEAGERTVLKKVPGKTDGFYKNLVSEDISEQLYFYITPIIIIAGFVFAVLASIGTGHPSSFAHSYATIMVSAAAFPAVSAFILPFSYAVSSLKKSGCVLAGWCGACDIYDSDATMITDEDVFPAGSVSLSGIKIFAGSNQQKVIEYSASLIIASKSGLSRVFRELLISQGFSVRQVESFSCYEGGGIGGLVDNENVLVGSGAFMNLMGIRVPDRVNVANTIFAAINDNLVAIYSVNYVPANSVHSALEALLTTKTDVLLAVKDFNVTPNTIQKKFKVSMEGVEYLPIETSYKLSDDAENKDKSVSAILCREGLAPLSEAISKGRNVKTVTEINTIISLVSSVIGMFLMFFLCKTSSFTSASADNVFFFMIAVEFGVIILSHLVKKRG